MRQGFLGLASLAGHNSGIRLQRAHGATIGRDGCGNGGNGGNAVDRHDFGFHRITLKRVHTQLNNFVSETKKPPSAGPKGALVFAARLSGAQTLDTTLPSRVGQA